MKKIYFFIIFVLFVSSLIAQQQKEIKYSIYTHVLRDDITSRESYFLLKKMKKKLKKKYVITRNTNIVIEPSVEVLSEKNIEGMENIVLTEVNIVLKVKNTLREDSDWTWDKTFKGKSVNRKESIKKAIKKFLRKDNGYEEFRSNLNKYLEAEFNSNCIKYLGFAKDQYTKKNLRKCINICNQISKESSCYTDAKILKKDAFDAIQKKECDALVQKAILKKSIKEYNSAVRYLIRISPDSPCAENALKLAKEMESSIDENTKSMKLIKVIIDSESKEEWHRMSIDEIYN